MEMDESATIRHSVKLCINCDAEVIFMKQVCFWRNFHLKTHVFQNSNVIFLAFHSKICFYYTIGKLIPWAKFSQGVLAD